MRPRFKSIEERAAYHGRTVEAIKHVDEIRLKRYRDRKERQVCVDCEGELDDDDQNVRCKACVARAEPSHVAWRISPRGLKVRRKAQRSFVKQRYNAGLCICCATPFEKWGAPTAYQVARMEAAKKRGKKYKRPQRCPDCVQKYTAYTREWLERKKNGEAKTREQRAAERKKRFEEAQQLKRTRRKEVKLYVPIDELLAQTSVKLLRGLERFGDWTMVGVLFDAIGVPAFDEVDHTERDRFTQRLSYLVRVQKYVERRRANDFDAPLGERFEYRITEAGRAELARVYERSKAA